MTKYNAGVLKLEISQPMITVMFLQYLSFPATVVVLHAVEEVDCLEMNVDAFAATSFEHVKHVLGGSR